MINYSVLYSLESMQQQRYNVFNQIHKGLRGMLYDTALRLQQTDFSQPKASKAIESLHQVLLFVDDHPEHEDRFILPHIHKHSAQLVDEFEKEHEVDHRLTQTLFEYIPEWKATDSASQREAIGNRF